LLAGGAPALAPTAAAQALSSGSSALGVCTGSLTLSLTNPLTPLQVSDGYSVGGTLACTGVPSGMAKIIGSGRMELIGSCAGFVDLFGSGTLTPPGGSSFGVAIAAAGPSAAQLWSLTATSGSDDSASAGVFSWLAPDEILNCLGPGTSTMTLTGALELATT
jgi:hypothetical protein